ncbi:HAD-IIIC family phosphatase [Terriglobus saanensis]|uniref:FkbH like protein n=1 Tax=Terriglobus saanensis (strain ATCC BAA-1853 / DSM 23119 / SP1PR4) TaxID=401053 RepID=E8UYQ4_TERSS|nr:HAD-IIIC family phosphatase [Terriglobus saanensis]ADV84270.1 FkbH like protein [Terriglobus saanensis SP1PR4]
MAHTSFNPECLLQWLPTAPADWSARLSEAQQTADPWLHLQALANFRLDFLANAKLDRALTKTVATHSIPASFISLRLGLLASSTTRHLLPSMRVAALRRGIVLEIYEGGYGQYMQELADPLSGLRSFNPQALLFAFDEHHIVELAQQGEPMDRVRLAWKLAREHTSAALFHQTMLPVFPRLLGSNEHRLSTSPESILQRFNLELTTEADREGAALLDVTAPSAQDGLTIWHDPALWHRAKQIINPAAAPLYAEALAPLLAAHLGRSRKCLVLDLDNTLWGGVIGDDGVEGIQLGHGHAEGEAFLAFHQFCLRLRDRGILLAVCSKNEEAAALPPFSQHPETLLRREHFAAFYANWQDKPTNLRTIAHHLNIGLDSLVFVDDNPFERALVRRELPEVAVPELPEDPALFAATIARAGYFESLGLTPEDLERARHYQANQSREDLRCSVTDLDGYLRSLQMELRYRPFDEANLQRIAQLTQKTNQFNVTTRRHTAEELRVMMQDPCTVTLQFQLRDSFGDNGTIALLIAFVRETSLVIDTWLMSCRVLGRRVEDAVLRLLVEEAKQRQLDLIEGEFRPTAKNTPVENLFPRLGFTPEVSTSEAQWFSLDVGAYSPAEIPMLITHE